MHQTPSTKTLRKYPHGQTDSWFYLILKRLNLYSFLRKVDKPVHPPLIMNNETLTNFESHKHFWDHI